MNSRMTVWLPAIALTALAAVSTAAPQPPGTHPGYLQALADLRTARYALSKQPGDKKVYAGEETGIKEIDAAVAEIKKASIDDGKGASDHDQVDVREHGSRLAKAIELLNKTEADIGSEENNPAARSLRQAAGHHVHLAVEAAVQAHEEWLRDEGKGKR